MTERLGLDADTLLSTTRAVRKRLDFDRPVPMEVVRECIELAMQAPSGSNAQGWHFVVVTDEGKRHALGEIYRKGWAFYPEMPFSAHKVHEGDPSMKEVQDRVVSSAEYLAQNIQNAPVLLIPCIEGRFDAITGDMANLSQASIYGSILPATWSFMLAARERGLGTAWTTIHLWHEREAAELLGIPYEGITQCAMIPVAYSKGTEFKAAPRKPLDPILHVDEW